MKRRVLNWLTLVSVLLCAAVVAVWVRSYWYENAYRDALGERHYGVTSLRGQVSFSWTSADAGWRNYRGGGEWTNRPAPRRERVAHYYLDGWCQWRLLGFGFGRGTFGTGITTGEQTSYHVVVPQWALAAVCLVAPGARGVALLRRRRRGRGGMCPNCGYDLRATPGRCPECGDGAREATSVG